MHPPPPVSPGPKSEHGLSHQHRTRSPHSSFANSTSWQRVPQICAQHRAGTLHQGANSMLRISEPFLKMYASIWKACINI